MPDPIELKVPEDYLNPGRPRLSLGQGFMQLQPQFQLQPPDFQLPAEPVAPLPPTSIEQRQGAMSTPDKFFAALQAMAAGLQGKPDPTQALHERQFERDQQRYLAEKQDYEQARRQFQQLKSQAELQTQHLEAQKGLAKDQQKFLADLEKAKEKHAETLQTKQLASEEFRTSVGAWERMILSDNVAAVQSGLAAIQGNPAAQKFFGNLDPQAILTQAKALQDSKTSLQTAQTRHLKIESDLGQLKYDIGTGAKKVPREMMQALGMPVDSLADTMTFNEVAALKARNPALASAILLSKGNALGALTSFSLIDAYDQAAKTGKPVDAQKVIGGLFDKLKETDEATMRALVMTNESLSKAIQGSQGNPELTQQILSFYLPILSNIYEKMGIKVDMAKLGKTAKEQGLADFSKALSEEAKKAEEAKRGRGGPPLPGLGKP